MLTQHKRMYWIRIEYISNAWRIVRATVRGGKNPHSFKCTGHAHSRRRSGDEISILGFTSCPFALPTVRRNWRVRVFFLLFIVVVRLHCNVNLFYVRSSRWRFTSSLKCFWYTFPPPPTRLRLRTSLPSENIVIMMIDKSWNVCPYVIYLRLSSIALPYWSKPFASTDE